jgi:hypothetical protein
MGIVCVACRVGSTSVEDGAKITLTLLRTSSAASPGNSSTVSAHIVSMTMFLAAFDVAKIAQSAAKHLHAIRGSGGGPEYQTSYPRNCR